MTDMLSTPEELLAKPCDHWCELEIMSAYYAIKELQWRIDNNVRGCQCSDDEACAHVRRAEKAEADLAAARAALRYFADSLSEFHGEEHHEDGCPDCDAMIEHAAAIAAARAEGGE